MSAQVIPFRRRVDQVLHVAEQERLRSVIVIGFDQNGEFYVDQAEVSQKDVLWMLTATYWHQMLGVYGHE